jgi:riboflavin synthase
MFTGIIEQTGTLISLNETGGVRRITVEAPGLASRLREGDSLGVSGVCLTALDPVVPVTSPHFDKQTTDWTLKVRVPENVRQWMLPKGSVAIEGISLTIADFDGEQLSIAILPLTYWRTNLHTLAPGAPLNVEGDVLVKLALAQMQAQKKPSFELTEAWLVASGY